MPLTRRLIGPLSIMLSLILHVTGANDDLYIETEPSVNLQRGILGLLPCTVKQRAYGVSWWKSSQSGHGEQLLIQMDTYFNPGQKIGTGFDQGLFDITDDYSLIIKNAQLSNSGEYFCEMIEFTTARLYRDKSNVTVSDIVGANDNYIKTEPSVNLQRGILGLLPCTVKQRAYSVSWWKSSPSSSEEQLLIHFEQIYNPGNKAGYGYEEGLFDIADNSSLIIKNVELLNSGKYFCLMGDLVTGQVYRDETNVTVFASPSEPFPSIAECLEYNAYGKGQKECSLIIQSLSFTLTCIVDKYSPSFTLNFTHNSLNMDVTNSRELENSDGSYNKSITIMAKVDPKPYVCIATGKDATGKIITSSSKVTIKLSRWYPVNISLWTINGVFLIVYIPVKIIRALKARRIGTLKRRRDFFARIDELLDFFKTADDMPTKVFVNIEEYESNIDKWNNMKWLLSDYLRENERKNDYNEIFQNVIVYLFHYYGKKRHTCDSNIDEVETDQNPEQQNLRGNGNGCTRCILNRNLECVLSCYCCITNMPVSARKEIGQIVSLQEIFPEISVHDLGNIPPRLLSRLARLIRNCSRNVSYNSLFNKNAIDCIKKLLKYENTEIKMLAYLSLFNKSDEDVDAKLCTEFFLKKLKAAQENRNLLQKIYGYTLLDLTEGLDKLASYEESGRVIVENNGINLLEEVLQNKHTPGSYQEKCHVARIIWQLAFTVFLNDVKEKRQLLTSYAELQETSAIPFRNACIGALFVIGGMEDQGDDNQVQEHQHIFLCCHRENKDRGGMLRELLILKGYNVKCSKRRIDDYNTREIVNAVKGSSVVVAWLTKKMKRCPYCRTEMTYAKKLGKEIIPVIGETDYNHHTEEGWVRDVVGQRSCYDFFTGELFEQNLRDLLQELGDKEQISS